MEHDRRHAPSRWQVFALQVLVVLGLLIGAVALGLHESQGATEVRGTLISVDHTDGGAGGTGLSTVQFTNASGQPVMAQVVIDLSTLASEKPGTPVQVFERGGQAVDEPQPRSATILARLVQALIIGSVLCLVISHVSRRHTSA